MTSPALITEEFISSFHSLQGLTIGERRKNLFLLLNKTLHSDQIDFSSLHPRTPLEDSFKLEALVHFRRIPELLNVLKSENPILIKKVLRVSWFLEEGLQSLSAEELVNTIFPQISFNAKVKIINKLALYANDGQKSNGIFEAIRKRYGTYLALKLISSCSGEFILRIIKERKVILTSKQLLVIVRKNPGMVNDFLEAIHSYMTDSVMVNHYQNVFLHFAKTNSSFFLTLYSQYNPGLRLGWRVTQKFILANKTVLLNDSEKLFKYLHKKQTFKSLGDDFPQFYKNFFPPTIKQFPGTLSYLQSLLCWYPSDQAKLNLIESTFREKYGSDLLQNLNCINIDLLYLLPPDRRKEIPSKPHFISEDRWVAFASIGNSIPFIKKRISLSSDIKSRESLVVLLIETCKINKDPVALVEVFKFFLNQHRNDHVSIRQTFLTTLKNSFELEHLDEEMWRYINELLGIFEMNHETFNFSQAFLLAHIKHRLLKGYDIEEQLKMYLVNSTRGKLFENCPDFEKRCLLLTGKLLPQICEGDVLKRRQIQFLGTLVNWNNRHPNDVICIFDFPDAVESLKQTLSEKSYSMQSQSVIRFILGSKSAGDNLELEKLALSKLSFTGGNTIINWLMQNKPLFIIENMELIFDKSLQYINHFFLKQCKNYAHLQLDLKLQRLSREEFESRQNEFKAKNAIVALSYLLKPEEFIEFASTFYPKDLRVDTTKLQEREQYKLQTPVADSLKNIIPPSLVLESILNFCKGDYLKLIKRSLYSVAGNVNEDKLPPFFNSVGERAVSVRKHTFHLTLRVLDRSRIIDVFNKFMAREKNSSIRKFLLKGSFNLFLQDPDDSLWELVKLNIRAVDAEDKEIVDIIMAIHRIPEQFLVNYIMFVWEFLGTLPDPDGTIIRQKFNLLSALSAKTIQLLPKSFCSEIIQRCLFKEGFLNYCSSIYGFTCKFIIFASSSSEANERTFAIFPALTSCFSRNEHRSMVDNFLRQFCGYFLNQKCLPEDTFLTFKNLWIQHIPTTKAFNHYLYLELCLMYIESARQFFSPMQIGEKLANLSDSLLRIYGAAIINIWCDALRSFIRNFFTDNSDFNNEKNRYLLIEGMIKTSTSDACLITAIALLKRNSDYGEVQLKHDEIVRFLTEIQRDPIQIHLYHQLFKM